MVFSCKPNIVGRKCDSCLAGHYHFPDCLDCRCDKRGTTEEICDQNTAACLCKKYVGGSSCDICREGTYNLQAENEDGCTECFCFGKTTRCISSNYTIFVMEDMDNWNVSTLYSKEQEYTLERSDIPINSIEDSRIGIDLTLEETQNNTLYFNAPESYLGKKLTSYGGHLKYTIFFTIDGSGRLPL